LGFLKVGSLRLSQIVDHGRGVNGFYTAAKCANFSCRHFYGKMAGKTREVYGNLKTWKFTCAKDFEDLNVYVIKNAKHIPDN